MIKELLEVQGYKCINELHGSNLQAEEDLTGYLDRVILLRIVMQTKCLRAQQKIDGRHIVLHPGACVSVDDPWTTFAADLDTIKNFISTKNCPDQLRELISKDMHFMEGKVKK